MLGAQLAFTYLPVMNRLFHSASIDAWWWGVLTAIGSLVFAAAEATKFLVRQDDTQGREPERSVGASGAV
jgi:hypothetical protein